MTWFTIANPSSMESGALVHLYDHWGSQLVPNPDDPSNGSFILGTPVSYPDRSSELMVEVLADHDSTDDFSIRLIVPNRQTGSGHYLKWLFAPGTGYSSAPIDPSLDAFNRGAADLSQEYEMSLRPYLEDGNRFYIVLTAGDGKSYYLQSETATNMGQQSHAFRLAPAGATPPPGIQNEGDNFALGSDWYFDVVSTSVTDTLTQPPQAAGSPQAVPSSQKVDPAKGGAWNPQNPTDHPLTDQSGGSYTLELETTATASFHWDVGIKVTEGGKFDVGVASASFEVSVESSFGGATQKAKSVKQILKDNVSSTTVKPHSQRILLVNVETVTYEQPFAMQIRRVVKLGAAPEPDTYDISIVGMIDYPNKPTLSGLTWGPDEPYGD